MNSQIKDKFLKTKSDDGKNHQAYSMELSRIKTSQEICNKNGNCVEYNKLGGDIRFNQIEPLVSRTQDINHDKKEKGMNAGLQNQFQKPKKGTEVNIAMVTKSSEHSDTLSKIMINNHSKKSKGENDKIITNSQALAEEISEIRYLIEYMNNNNKNKFL